MSLPSRLAPRLLRQTLPSSRRAFIATTPARKNEEWPQRTPIGPYYEEILTDPIPYPFEQKPEEPPNSADPEVLPEDKKPIKTPESRPAKKKPGRKPKSTTTATTSPDTASATESKTFSPLASTTRPVTPEEKARIIFGTRLAGPDDKEARTANKTSKATNIAGVLVPPMPEEPDNCCMSGCVNCVWDLFREDMEEYSAKRREAEQRLAEREAAEASPGQASTPPPAPKGVELGDAKIAKDMWDDDVFGNVPVGIREFMKQEKRLKEKHAREGTSG